MERRYGLVLATWLPAVFGLPLLAVVAIAYSVSRACENIENDCSWGFEYLLALPVLLFTLVVLGPLTVFAVLRSRSDPLAAATAWWVLALVVPAAVAAFLSWGAALAFLPPLGGRFIALRRAGRRAGSR